jgi:poly(3-hydroxyalkanoate) synthetase
MTKEQLSSIQRISVNDLLADMGTTPADNAEGYSTAVPWKSQVAGELVKALFDWKHCLEQTSLYPLINGPLAYAAGYQKKLVELYVTDPIKRYAQLSVRTKKNPDMFGEMNAWIYKSYASMLHNLCGNFMTYDRFDRKKADQIVSTPDGKKFLKGYLDEFTFLENNYGSRGLTRLHAMKDLLKALLILITETPLINGEVPFRRRKKNGGPEDSFGNYLEENRARVENLYREDAFDIREFSERATGGMIGYLPFENVEGSSLHSVNLRRYERPNGVQTNGKVLYLASPLINKPEIFDLAKGKSIVEGMLNEGYDVYLVDHGDPGFGESQLGLDFYCKTIHDKYLDLIQRMHPGSEVYPIGYCMGGTLLLPYLARRAEERKAMGLPMDIRKVSLMATPVKFDDEDSGMAPMREVIRKYYDPDVMKEFFGSVNVPPQIIDYGMNLIQPGVQFYMAEGFYERAYIPNAVQDAAPFLYWITHGTKFPERAHEEWVNSMYMQNSLVEGTFKLPSVIRSLDMKPVDMNALRDAGVSILSYRGDRDVIAPIGSCVAGELWGGVHGGNISVVRGEMNRTIEKHAGHIFIVSKKLLKEYLELVSAFFKA